MLLPSPESLQPSSLSTTLQLLIIIRGIFLFFLVPSHILHPAVVGHCYMYIYYFTNLFLFFYCHYVWPSPSITLSHCMLKSHNSSTSSDSIILLGWCSYHFSVLESLYFPQVFQCIIVAQLSCLLLYSFNANMLHSLVIWCTLSPFFHTLYIMEILHFYQCFLT